MIKISPSLLAADFAKLGDEVKAVEKAGAALIHLDVMDGMFVPNISFGAPIIKALRPYTALSFDTHLMIQTPLKYIKDFVLAGSDYITIHYESEDDTESTIDLIHSYGKKAGVSIKPHTSVERICPFLHKLDLVLVMSVEPGFGGQKFMPNCIDKIKELAEIRFANDYSFEISVDGGISVDTIGLVAAAGVDIAVAGSSIFGKDDYDKAINELIVNAL